MNKQIFITMGFLLFVIVGNPQTSFAQSTPIEIDAKTFMLSNESPGYLIDNLIANGYGDSSLYAVMQYLQPLSGGAIPQWFMDSLAACPAKSDIFTAELWNFSDPSNNPIGIAEDGTLVVAPIYGSDLSGKEGYTTYNDTLVPVSLKLFTEAIGPEFYIDAAVRTADGIKTYYQVFAIAWSMGSTFVLSNEGGLIDDLIRAGNGDKNLYQTLQILKPKSGGVITDEFMATLANCPAGSEIFTAVLKNFAGLNNPVCVNTDGTLKIKPIFGKDYLSKDGFTSLPLNQSGYASELFTYANSADKYIDAGIFGQSRYKAFAIAWKASTTFVLSNEGGLIDDLIRAGHGTKNLYQTLEILKTQSGGVISDEFMATLANCPTGSEIFTAALSNFGNAVYNPICINTDGTLTINAIYGKDYLLKDGYSTIPINQKGYTSELFTHANSAENYIDAGSSSGQSIYKAFAIAWKASTTFVLSNEGGLIDDLIRAGHGTKNLYQTLEILKPKSGGVISDEFMAALANCPAGSEIFTVTLNNFANVENNPVCINTDGTLHIAGIFGKNYLGKTGFATSPQLKSGYVSELFTYATTPTNYIDAGSGSSNLTGGGSYKAFAIAWKASTTFVLSNEGGLIDYLIARGYGNSNLWQTLVTIASSSGGVISEEFLETLALCPAGSEIFTKKLNTCAGMEGALAINTDGTVHDVPLFGKDYFQKPGYKTYPNIFMVGVGREVFTHASVTEYYIDAGSNGGITYQAFAIAWSMAEAPTTFVLSNEGGLIDYLIAAGNGSGSPYDALLTLQSSSGGVISDEFLDKLATCTEGSEVFTAKLSTFAGLNNPVCVNSDGTLRINPIFGKDYFGKEGYTTYPESQAGVGRELFTYSTNPEYYIDAGASLGESRYKAFAIAWSNPTVGILEVETSRTSYDIYPNPFSEGFYITNLPVETHLEIFDIRGKLIYHAELKANIMVHPGLLSKGIYILKLINSQGSTQQKIVKY